MALSTICEDFLFILASLAVFGICFGHSPFRQALVQFFESLFFSFFFFFSESCTTRNPFHMGSGEEGLGAQFLLAALLMTLFLLEKYHCPTLLLGSRRCRVGSNALSKCVFLLLS